MPAGDRGRALMSSVLDLDAAHHDQPLEDEVAARLAGRRLRTIVDAAHDREGLARHLPVRRDLDLDAAPYHEQVDHRRVSRDAPATQVDVVAAHDGGDVPAPEVLAHDLAAG